MLALLVGFPAGSPTALAVDPYGSYTYSSEGDVLPSPAPYLPDEVWTGAKAGSGDWKQPSDVFVAGDRIYVTDSGNHRIVVLDGRLSVVRTIDGFDRGGVREAFNQPQGVFVAADGTIYVADTGNARIVVLDADGALVREVRTPESDVLPKGFVFAPMKLAVDKSGRMFVISKNVFEGMMEFDARGGFVGFTGANRVVPNMLDYIWKRFLSTRAQRSAMQLFLPTEFDNVAIDEEGFIYTVTATADTRNPIRRQNGSGDNILRVPEGRPGPVGDVRVPSFSGTVRGPSSFVDVAVRPHGIYSALDAKRGHIFTYDADGNLLYVFGSLGDVWGTFKQPVALDYWGDRLLVLDKIAGQLTVFRPTEYALLIQEALYLHNTGRYAEAAARWREVAERNVNFEIAYIGIGKSLLREGRYREAMRYFKLGDDRKNYSKAFKLYREQLVRQYLDESLLVAAASGIGLAVYRRRRRRAVRPARDPFKLVNRLRYAFHVMFHPFDGFWDLKHERRGSVPAAWIWLFLLFVAVLIDRQWTGFIFNPYDPDELNVFNELMRVAVPVGLWCVANWCITTLMDGEGTFKDIFIATSYSTVPLVLVLVPAAMLSNAVTREEGAFLVFFRYGAVLWTVYLLFAGMLTVHQYSPRKTVFSMAATVVGIGIILFIALLFFYLLQQLLTFGLNVYKEISFR